MLKYANQIKRRKQKHLREVPRNEVESTKKEGESEMGRLGATGWGGKRDRGRERERKTDRGKMGENERWRWRERERERERSNNQRRWGKKTYRAHKITYYYLKCFRTPSDLDSIFLFLSPSLLHSHSNVCSKSCCHSYTFVCAAVCSHLIPMEIALTSLRSLHVFSTAQFLYK